MTSGFIGFGPDLESYYEGQWAHVAEECSDANPYEPGSRDYSQWLAGWEHQAEIDAFGAAPRCNHWPGQARCDVCGLGSDK